mmetsp:Transcript_7049/g.5856  ORF Transcript_7049/g.5856 Transcript_7049/m.5856 type:complete len:80 (-) Transcript_7049:56-295(-)
MRFFQNQNPRIEVASMDSAMLPAVREEKVGEVLGNDLPNPTEKVCYVEDFLNKEQKWCSDSEGVFLDQITPLSVMVGGW